MWLNLRSKTPVPWSTATKRNIWQAFTTKFVKCLTTQGQLFPLIEINDLEFIDTQVSVDFYTMLRCWVTDSFLISDCSGIIVLQLKEAETEKTFIVYPSANKNSSPHCSSRPEKDSEMYYIDPYHWICKSWPSPPREKW